MSALREFWRKLFVTWRDPSRASTVAPVRYPDTPESGRASQTRSLDPMLYPQDVDDALSKHVGEDWRTRDFDADIFIDGQIYNIKHSLLRRAILTIDGTDYHSDQWTFG